MQRIIRLLTLAAFLLSLGAALFLQAQLKPTPYDLEARAIALLTPVVVAGAPLIASGDKVGIILRVLAGCLLTGFVVIASASVGLFFAPAAIAMLVAALLSIFYQWSRITER